MTGEGVNPIRSFKDIIAWQKAMDLVEQIYQLTVSFPADERFGLISQLRRAAVSVPSNISEGYGRRSRADYVHFLYMARGSANELETELLLSARLGFGSSDQIDSCLALTCEIQRILKGLVASLDVTKSTKA